MIMWRKRIACWLPKATNTPSVYVTRIVFTLQRFFDERATMLGYINLLWQNLGI